MICSTLPEDFHYISLNVPCQWACPVHTNVPAYIRALSQGDPDRAYDINLEANLFPGVLGRICSRPCERHCRHGERELGSPVNICHLKRASADLYRRPGVRPRSLSPRSGRRVAVIGAGPAGLAAAHDLTVAGVAVILLEAMPGAGGMLRYGIPEFRLPRDVLFAEINRILEMGVELRTGVRVGTDFAVSALLREYDAVLVAAGCYDPNSLRVPGERLSGVIPGLGFMMDVCKGRKPRLGQRVLVIGAGFTAFDCARTALRLGAKDVRICLRRTEEDLSVTADELHEAKSEGVHIESLLLSRSIIGSNSVEGVQFVRTRLGDRRSDGKREIAPIEGSAFELTADTVIVATGQGPLGLGIPGPTDKKGLPRMDRETFQTGMPKLYAAGDYLTGPSSVIEAIASGRRAAGRILTDLDSKGSRLERVRMEDAPTTDRKRLWDFIPPAQMPTHEPVSTRLEPPFPEVETGYTREMAEQESRRCYLCYLHYEIDIRRCIYCRYCIDAAPRDCIKLVEAVKLGDDGAVVGLVETADWSRVNAVVIDNARCIRCGECKRVCPVDCISVTRVELEGVSGREEVPHG
jgi:formate dehydrogenase major subunit